MKMMQCYNKRAAISDLVIMQAVACAPKARGTLLCGLEQAVNHSRKQQQQ